MGESGLQQLVSVSAECRRPVSRRWPILSRAGSIPIGCSLSSGPSTIGETTSTQRSWRGLDRFDCYEATIAIARQAILLELACRPDRCDRPPQVPTARRLSSRSGRSVRRSRSDPTFTRTANRGYMNIDGVEGIDGVSRVHFVLSRADVACLSAATIATSSGMTAEAPT